MKGDRVYLLHIKDAINRVDQYTMGGKTSFLSTPMIQDAVVRNLEIMGEAVKQLSDDLKRKCPAVPWKRIAGMRDKMIHEYFGVDLQLVWEVVERDVRELRLAVDSMLEELAENP